jgi:preprotein translocase subunit SecB
VATANTGFPPLLLDPIDFASAYMAQVDAAQQQLESQDQGAGELTGEGTGEA